MKTNILVCSVVLLTSLSSFSQTFHSDVQIDPEKAWTYSKGISRERLTFIVDLIKNELSVPSLNITNAKIQLLDSRVIPDEKGKFKKSKYSFWKSNTSVGYFYIEDYAIVRNELIIGKFNKSFTLQLIKDGKQTSLLACSIKETDLPIKYNPKTTWCQYNQSFNTNYNITYHPLTENQNGEWKRSSVIFEFDTINQYLSINNNPGLKLEFVKEGTVEYAGGHWNYEKYKIDDFNNIRILRTDSAVIVDDEKYNLVLITAWLDDDKQKEKELVYFFTNTSPVEQETIDENLIELQDGQ